MWARGVFFTRDFLTIFADISLRHESCVVYAHAMR